MNRIKSKLRKTALITGNLLVVVIPLNLFFYSIIALLTGLFNPSKWDFNPQCYFVLGVGLSLLVGAVVTSHVMSQD